MKTDTEAQKKTIKTIQNILGNNSAVEKHLIPQINDIAISPFDFGKDVPNAIVVSMPTELLTTAKLEYSNIVKELKKIFVNNVILFVRNSEIVPIKGHNPNRAREAIIQDLVFPSKLVGRVTEVQSLEDMSQEILLDAKNQCWSKPELSTIERILIDMFKAEFRIRVFAVSK